MLPSLVPGFIHSYDAAARICRVRIPGLTDGAEVMPEASMLYAMGDKSEHTEVRILAGDRVWLAFVNGDPRHPVIMGYRPKETDNAVGWRRWHHDNFEFTADGTFRVNAKAIELNAETITASADTATINANTHTFGALTNDGKDVGDTHKHGAVKSGGDTSGTPV